MLIFDGFSDKSESLLADDSFSSFIQYCLYLTTF